MTSLRGNQSAEHQWIAAWLFGIAFMVLVMVIIGGLTRLTDSGLSMVDWRPITGWFPPLTEAGWQAAFDAYRQFPEYQKVNAGMTLAEFQGIFWLEYIHRLWGRLIGIAFFFPLVFFAIRGWLDRPLGLKLVGLLVLGGMQGVVGWLMVKSGLVDRPDVSHYRLATHFGLALLIYAGLIWVALSLIRPMVPSQERGMSIRKAAILHWSAISVCVLVLITALWGALVAGLDAGLAYNTFPLMDGELVPAEIFRESPWYGSFFDHVGGVQFMHRLLALMTLCSALWLAWQAWAAPDAPIQLRWASLLLAMWVVVQGSLGAATVLLFVPVIVASLHQASGMILWTITLVVAYETTRMRSAPGGEVVARRITERPHTVMDPEPVGGKNAL